MLVEREAWLSAQLEEANRENGDMHQDLVNTMKDLGGCKVRTQYIQYYCRVFIKFSNVMK